MNRLTICALALLIFGCGYNDSRTASHGTSQPESSSAVYAASQDAEPMGAVPDSGKERWDVKIGRDPSASKVHMTPVATTVEALRAMPPAWTKKPALSDKTRYPGEFQVYQVTAKIVGFKAESDIDIHCVIASLTDPTKTMIVEFPDAGQGSKGIWAKQTAAARASFVKLFGTPGKWKKVTGRTVTITGPFFTDFIHGQAGVAPSGVELHPCLSIVEVK